MQDIGPLAKCPGHLGGTVIFFLWQPESFQSVFGDEGEGRGNGYFKLLFPIALVYKSVIRMDMD